MNDDTTPPSTVPAYEGLRDGILDLLVVTRRQAARRVNALMTATYWEIGRRIVDVELDGADRAGYGDVLVERLADDLGRRFGRGFSRSNLFQMRAFYVAWPADRIVQTVSGQSNLLISPTASNFLARVRTPATARATRQRRRDHPRQLLADRGHRIRHVPLATRRASPAGCGLRVRQAALVEADFFSAPDGAGAPAR